jgi:hypothetical protein
MRLTERQLKWLTVTLTAATIAAAAVFAYLLLPPPEHLFSPPPAVRTPLGISVAHANDNDDELPRMELPKVRYTPARRSVLFMPANDPGSEFAQRLLRFLDEAKLTGPQQQLFFGLLYVVYLKWDVMISTPHDMATMVDTVNAHNVRVNSDIDRQMQEVLTPAQWQVYKVVVQKGPGGAAALCGTVRPFVEACACPRGPSGPAAMAR